jgi:hypothetical protein
VDTLTAIGTLILAAATVVLAYFTYWTGKQAVKIAAEDRKRDDDRRADDRARDDRLRREQLDEINRREEAERREREDRDARRVTVIEEGVNQVNRSGPNRRIIVSCPNISPIKQVRGAAVGIRPDGGFNITEFGGHAPPDVDAERTRYRFLIDIPDGPREVAYPIMRWVDGRGNLYYQFRQHTMRFSQSTDFGDAASTIDKWIRTGATPNS